MGSPRKRTLLVGLDAACWKYVDPLLEAGRLPGLGRLKASGRWGRLHSTMPPFTPAAWSSIVTGKKPLKHGVFDFVRRAENSYQVEAVTATDRLGTPLWVRLNEAGLKVGLVNVPVSYPVGSVEGFFIGGFGCPNGVSGTTSPEPLLRRIEVFLGETYQPTVELPDGASPEEKFRADRDQQERHVCIIEDLLSDHEIDVLVVNLMLYDHANHYMPDRADVDEALCATDKHLARILQAFEPTHVLAISDHGSERVCGTFLCFNWLRDHGLLASQKRSAQEQKAALNWVVMEWLQGRRRMTGAAEKMLRRALVIGLSNGPDRLTSALWKYLQKAVPAAREHVRWRPEIDYRTSRLYAPPASNGLIFINLVGREPEGKVKEEDRHRLAREAARCLESVRDPILNRSLVTHVEVFDLSPEQVAAGWPDLAVFSETPWRISLAPYDARAGKAWNRYFIGERLDWLGKHSCEGMYVFRGNEFRAGAGMDASVWDIPATLLYLYDIPVPEDFDGRIIRDAFVPRVLVDQPVRWQPGDRARPLSPGRKGSTPGSEQLLKRLKQLGYLAD